LGHGRRLQDLRFFVGLLFVVPDAKSHRSRRECPLSASERRPVFRIDFQWMEQAGCGCARRAAAISNGARRCRAE
jgi:hypothetical protein